MGMRFRILSVLAFVAATLVAATDNRARAANPATQPASQPAEPLRVVTKADGLTCHFSQDLSAGLSSPFGGSVSAASNHLKCTDEAGNEKEIELISADPAENVDVQNGKIAIKTKDFGTVYRGNEEGKFGVYELTDSQIKKLKTFLASKERASGAATQPTRDDKK